MDHSRQLGAPEAAPRGSFSFCSYANGPRNEGSYLPVQPVREVYLSRQALPPPYSEPPGQSIGVSLETLEEFMGRNIRRHLQPLNERVKNLQLMQNIQHIAIMNMSTRRDMHRTNRAWTSRSGSNGFPMRTLGSSSRESKFEEVLGEILSLHGRPGFGQKVTMLWIWRYKRRSLSEAETKRTLLDKASEFLHRRLRFDAADLEEIFRSVITIVPDGSWLRFVRTKLGLEEMEIRRVKRTSKPTEEQLHLAAVRTANMNQRTM